MKGKMKWIRTKEQILERAREKARVDGSWFSIYITDLEEILDSLEDEWPREQRKEKPRIIWDRGADHDDTADFCLT